MTIRETSLSVSVHRPGKGTGTFFPIDDDAESIEQSRLLPKFRGKNEPVPDL